MTNQLAKPSIDFTFEDHQIRTIFRDGEPWFYASDICDAIAVINHRDAISKLDDDEKGVALTDTLGGKQNLVIVSESGLYTLILRCRDAVKQGTLPWRFRKWVTNEVLPSIRKTGRYQAEEKRQQAARTTVDDRTPLRSLVNRIMAKYGTTYQSVYKLVHREFGVNHIDELSSKQAAEAMEYLATKAIEGEFLGKPQSPALAQLDINYPGDWWLKNSIAVQKENAWAESDGVINMSLMVLKRKEESAIGRILFELRRNGYNVDAGYIELNAMKHHLELSTRFIEAIQEKSYQAIHRGFHAKM